MTSCASPVRPGATRRFGRWGPGVRAGRHWQVTPLILAFALSACRTLLDFDECDAFQDCQDRGAGYTCREHLCVAPPPALVRTDGTPLCRTHGAVADPAARLIGTLLPSQLDAEGPPLENGAMLALDLLNGAATAGQGPPFGLVLCDSAGSAEQAAIVAQYLVDLVGVRALIGDTRAESTLHAARTVTVPAGALLISPAASAPEISDLDDNDLLWRVMPSDTLLAEALAEFVVAEDVGRVTVVYRDDTYGQALQTAFARRLLALRRADLPIHVFAYPSPDSTPFDAAGPAADIVSGSPEVPDAVVAFGREELVALLVAAETRWADEQPTKARPLWLFADEGRTAAMRSILDEARRAADPLAQSLYTRVRGTAHASGAAPAYADFRALFEAEFGTAPGAFAEHAYDATWLAALALATVEPPPNGPALAGTLRRCNEPGAPPFTLGLTDWGAALESLRSGDAVDVQGASGLLDMDDDGEPMTGSVELWWVEYSVSARALAFRGQRFFEPAGTVNAVSPPPAVREAETPQPRRTSDDAQR